MNISYVLRRWYNAQMKYRTNKFELSGWFIQFSTYSYHTLRFTTDLSFQYNIGMVDRTFSKNCANT